MQRLKILGLALLAVFVLSAVASATASAALPEFSPAKGKLTSTSAAKSQLETSAGSKIQCEKSKGTGEITGEKTGTFDELFEGCLTEVAGFELTCTGLSDTTAGSILAKGKFEIDYDTTKTKVLTVFKPEEVHFSCEIGAIKALVNVKGEVAVPITPINVLGTAYEVDFKQTKGEQEFKESAGKKDIKLLSAKDEAAAELSAEELLVEIVSDTEGEIIA